MLTYRLVANFPGRYIAHPYWPEQFELIEITKKSGMSRARSTANARKALEEYLRQIELSLADYERLRIAAARPFHTDADGRIVIPSESVTSFLVNTAYQQRHAQRICDPDQVRARLVCSDWLTDRIAPDGVWKRFATPNAGPGGRLSNQRSLRENAYIEQFSATGTITFDPQFVEPPVLENALHWGGTFVGIGASRKMGMGRFLLREWHVVADSGNGPSPLSIAAE